MIAFLEVPEAPQRPLAGRALPTHKFPLKCAYNPASDDLVERVTAIAVTHFLAAVSASADHQAPFKFLLTIQVGDEHKPLLLVGTAHGVVEDGSIIAVLNPDGDLVEKLSGSWGCNSAVLREAVAKKCDLALSMWIDAYRPDGVCLSTRYVARETMPAKFAVPGLKFSK